MTTQTTTIEAGKPSARALIGMTVATVALLGGALLWQQGRSTCETAAPRAAATVDTANEGAAPMGGQAATNGMAELDGAPAPALHTIDVASAGVIPDVYARLVELYQAVDGATPLAATVRVGGTATIPEHSGCGSTVGTAAC